MSGTVTHHLTPGNVLLVGPGDLLVVVVTLLGRTPRHLDRGQITKVGLKVGIARHRLRPSGRNTIVEATH